MINVKYTEKSSGQKQESDFKDQAELDQHKLDFPYMYSEETMLVDVTDTTVIIALEKKKFSKKEIRLACHDLFDSMAIENEDASPEKMDLIFMDPKFTAIISALVTGAPKSAKRYVQTYGPALYSEEKIADLVLKLDAIIALEG
jgi:16S rRNA G966 N2-methylase RsmD